MAHGAGWGFLGKEGGMLVVRACRKPVPNMSHTYRRTASFNRHLENVMEDSVTDAVALGKLHAADRFVLSALYAVGIV